MDTLLPLQNYIVSHINRQQALVIVEHQSGRFNLYLSDITGRFFSMSLPDIVITRNGLDLEVVSELVRLVGAECI